MKSPTPKKASRGSPGRPHVEVQTETLNIEEDDAAFILGKGGKTKGKIERVSGAQIELIEEGPVLEVTGTDKQRVAAFRYIGCVLQQRRGDVILKEEDVMEDCTVLAVPQQAVAFVTGRGGNHLRTLEESHGVLMVFADIEGVDPAEDELNLMIFGDRGPRRGAQLDVMGTVECKVPGYYTELWRKDGNTFDCKADCHGDWGTSTTALTQEELSYAIGAKGRTRKKLKGASGAIIQYVGEVVFMSGTKLQREKAKEYLKWLLELLDVADGQERPRIETSGRDDCTTVQIPTDCIGYITGRSREMLGTIEDTYGTLMFFVGEQDNQVLAIFGPARARKGSELMVMSQVERKNDGYYTQYIEDRKTNTVGFDTDNLTLDGEDLAYALGKDGVTKQKLAAASGAILQFVGTKAFIAGTQQERRRCRDYLGWLLEQKDGAVALDLTNRTDVLEMEIDGNDIGFILGPRGLPELRRLELESQTFCFINDVSGVARIVICGHAEGSHFSDFGRLKAEHQLKRLIREQGRGGGGGKGWRERSRSRGTGRKGGGGDQWSRSSWSDAGTSWTAGAGAKRQAPSARDRSMTPPWRKSSESTGGSWGGKGKGKEGKGYRSKR